MNKWGIFTQTIGVTILGVIAGASTAQPLTTVEEVSVSAKPPVKMMDWGDIIRISLSYLPPEFSLYKVKHGAAEVVDCHDQTGYKIPFWPNILLRKDQLPVTLCVVAYDQADNSSIPWEFAVK